MLANWMPLSVQQEMDVCCRADFASVLDNKLMGQVNLLRYGQAALAPGGSVTFATGTAAQSPMPGTSSISMAVAGLEGFIRAASLELNRIRLNAVSPSFVKESMDLMGLDSRSGISAADTAKTYVAAIEGDFQRCILQTADFVQTQSVP